MVLIMEILVRLLTVFSFVAFAETKTSGQTHVTFSSACVAWNLSPSNIIGQGWVFSGFCKNSSGTYGWDDSNLLDDCIGTDEDGQLAHISNGKMSHRCTECNSNNGWGHTSSLDHTLVCNCTSAGGDIVQSSIDMDATYGYFQDRIDCLPVPAAPARAPNTARDLVPTQSGAAFSAPVASPFPLPIGSSSFASSCCPGFQVTGNLPHFGSYNPRVMWAQCADNQGEWANTSLDLGLCFGVSHGFLISQRLGLFNETCFDCVQDLDVWPATLLCHCENDPVFNTSTTYNATTIPIEPTIEVVNGILSCYGFYGDRGATPPSEFFVEDWEVPKVDKKHALLDGAVLPTELSKLEAVTRVQRSGELTVRESEDTSHAQGHCCFWETCSHDMATLQPEPWLFTRCRRIGEDEPLIIARFNLSQAFRYDLETMTIQPGDGLYDNGHGCLNCHTGGSWLYCLCPEADGTLVERSINLSLYVSNMNGTLCSSSYCGDHEPPTAPTA